jgi:hypothetical protein
MIFVGAMLTLWCTCTASTAAAAAVTAQHVLRREVEEDSSSQVRRLEAPVNVNHVNYLYPSKEIPYHWFGEAVSVSDDMAIVGAPGTEDFSNYGVAYVYHKRASSGDQSWEEVAALEPPTKGVYASFGAAVSISRGCAFVGAPK